MAYSFQPCKYTKKKLIVVIEFSFLNENKLFFAMSDILRIFAKPNRKHIIFVTSCFANGKMAERSNVFRKWKDGRAVECGGLENR